MKNILNFIPFIISSIICSILIPNPLNYIKINQKSPIDIYSPYDIKVYKTKAELKSESLKIISRVYPVFIYNDYKIKIDKNTPLYEFIKIELEKYLRLGIISDEEYKFLENDPSEKISIYIDNELYEKNKNSLITFSRVYDTIISQIKMVYPDSVEKIKLFLLENLKPNLKLDLNLTNKNRENALKTIDLYKYRINKNELIVKKGDIIDSQTYEKIASIYKNKSYILNNVLLILFLFILWANLNISRRGTSTLNNIILNIAIILFAIIHSIIINLSFPYVLNFSVFFSLLLSFLVPRNIAINFSTTSSILLGIYYNMNFYAFIWNLIISIGVILSSNIIKRRYHIVFLAVLFIPIGILLEYILNYLNIEIYEVIYISASISTSLILSITTLLILERTTRLTTTFNLLDIASLEHPLIEMLRDKAPGTYNHSINVSILAQEAAEEIGANALICKVGAYFHDIGKIKNPQYFIENQTGYNPHDELEPLQSAKIIIEHVIEGVKLAKKYGLPNAIVDIIRTHHGTTVLEHFYKKAVQKNPNIDKRLFQYPGPNPRNKEEAIVMLADSVEAAVRSLKEKDKESIKKIVRSILIDRWENGYLENTDLKRKDLEKIEEVFIKVLESIYHPRIAYD